MKATVRVIAKEAGVSPATVSRVLSGSAPVSPRIRAQVLKAAQNAGYLPEELRTVAILLQENDIHSYAKLILGELLNQLSNRKYHPLALHINDLPLLDAIPICGAISLIYSQGLEKVWNRSHAVPLVCINNYSYPLEGVYRVNSNAEQGILSALQYFYDNNHRNIGMLTNDYNTKAITFLRRIQTFHQFIETHPDCSGVQMNAMVSSSILDSLMQMLRSGVTAILAAGERIGIVAQHYLTTCGCRIPEDVSIIGFEDRYISQYLNPPQTCVEQRMDAMAMNAIDILEKQLQGKHDLKDISIPCNLIIRDTVAPPKQRDPDYSKSLIRHSSCQSMRGTSPSNRSGSQT